MAAQATAEDEIGEEGLDDMINLSVLTEQALLTNIHRRYDRQHIYTYVGSILVAVNPYKMFNIYGVDMVRKYEGQVLGTLPPHLFAIGSSAYSKMLKDNQSQVIVISGESGAGKTESTKLIMQYLAVVNQSDNNLVTEQILEASPLLEAFGNAKTIRNDNSSRFGKYVEVYFNNGKIIGAKNSEYLLEKSRIVTQNKDERNYHVFYEMLMGMDVKTKKKYGLLEPADYFYLNRGGNWGIPGKDEAGDFSKLKAAMDVLAFSTEEQENIFKILAAILQLGNVYFKKKGNDNQDGVEIGEENEIKWVALLLQLPEDWLKEALTTKVTEARQERLLTPFTVAQALDARDAIAKALYQRLFTWLVERINQIVYKSDKSVSIAILDIFGFEDFKINSFEQLCINYANEALQLYFNRHIFRLEQEAYSKERINWEVIDFQDNQPVIDLLARKPSGLIHLLDDESHFPKGTDQSFLDKCHYNYSVTSLYSKPKLASLDFVINHYAGHVNYNVKGFIEKNKDTLRSDVVELLIQSENEMISEMFRKLRDKLVTRTVNKATGRFMTMKPKTPTVAANFNESLLKLIDRMSKCNPLFVRCIKPNASKQAMTFETSVVLDQLRYTGMLETIRIRKLGYPIRMRFTAFIDRFHCLMDGKKLPNRSNPKNVCDVIMTKVGGVPFQQYQLGTTRVFMRESFNTHLESERHTVLRRAVIVIQKYARAFVARKQYHRMVSASIRLQASIRRWIQRSKYVLMRKGFIKTQAQYRMRRQRKLYIQRRDEHRRRIEEDRIALEMAKQKAEREAKEKKARAVANVSRLEIPPELAFIFSQIDSWRPMHDTRHIIQTENVQLRESNVQLPEDVNSYAFTKYTNVYFKNHSWQMKRQPVKSSFLQKQTKQEAKQSVGIFQLVMRFMNDAHLAGKKETILGNYIVQQGLKNANLRDEIYCQLCTQTWKNNNVSNCERGWILMANCLSCFPPSPTLYNYLLKYVSDHAYNGYKPYCQYKLLQCSEIERPLARTYPPCLLEWMASKKRMNMAVPITFPDGQEMLGHVTSWSTSEDFAHDLLQLRMIVENNYGWTVSLQDDYATYELAGYDYVLDLLSEMEIPPKFPTLKSYFLVSIDRRRTTEARRNASDDSPHNPDSFNTLDIEVEELLQTPPPIRRTPPPPQPSSQPRRPVVEQNHDNVTSLLSQDSKLNQRPAVVTTPGLSRQSRMNERYTKRMAPAPPRAPSPVLEEPEINVNTLLSDSKLNNRYVSVVQVNGGLPNGRPVNGHGVPNGRVPNGSAPQMNGNGFDLSSSKLNQRYSKSNNAAQQRNKNFRKQGSREMLRSKSIISEDGRSIRSSNPTDMDQWVDNVFDQVLDSDFDGLSDARTLENNIRGGKKCVSDHSDREAQSAHLEEWIDDLFENITDEDLKRMSDCELVSESLKGGGKGIPGYSQPGPHVSNINVGLPQTAGSLNFGSNASLNIPGLPGALPMYNPGLVPPMGAYHQDPGQAFAVQQALQVQQTANIQASLQQTVLENQLLQHSLQQEVLKQQLQQLQLQTYQMTATNPVPVGVPTVAPSHLDLQSGVVPNGQVPHAGLIAPVPAPLQVVTAAPNAVGNIKSTFERQSSVESKNSSFEFRRSSEESRRSSADSRRSSTDRQPQSPPKFPKPITGATSNRNRGVAFSDAVENIPRESISEEDPLSPAPAISPSRQREVVKSAAPPAPPAPTSPVKHSAPSQLPPPPATYYEHVDVPEVFDNLEPIPEDVEGRAKTIRVGKVRWPPLVEKKGNKKEHVGKLFIEEQKQTPESLRTKTAGQLHDQTMQLIRARSNENLIDDGEQPSTSAAKPRPERSQSAPKKLDMSRLSVLETHMKSRVNSLPTTPVSQKKPAPRPPAIEKVALPPPPPPPPISTIPQFGAPPPPPPPLVMATRPLPSPPVETSVQTETLVKVASKVSMHSEIIQTEDVDVVDAESMDELDEVPLILDHGQLERIKTELYQAFSGPFYTYSNVPWNLNVRKEVFTPGEKLENNLVVHLIFCQIVNDVFNGSSIRIHKDDRVRMKTLLENNGITQDNVLTRDHKHQVKKNVVELAREWPIYFSRLFPVYGGRRSPDMQYLSIGHSGIRLLHREKDLVEDKFEILDHCKYSDVLEVQVPRDDAIQLNLDGEWVIAYTPRAKQIKNLVDAFCIEAEKDSLYVKAVKNYITHESTLLCFKKGDLIKLTNKDMKLDRGWLYGSLYGRAGMFPEAYVVKLSKTELRRSQKRTAPAPPAEITLSNGNGVDSQSDIISQTGSIIADGKYSMIEFAVMNFRESLNKEGKKWQKAPPTGSDWTWQEHAEMVKWTRSPIQASLLRLPNSQLNKLALECFICIMQYMGDYPMDSSHDDLDCAMRLLRTCHKNRELIDEVYCQLCKQTTNNKSTRPDSCQRGWKLFVILAAWFKCSDALLPYLDKYLQTVAFDESRPYRKPASVSLQNLRTTFRYGGRKNVPQKVELEALTSGRYNKRQGVMTPGGVPVTLNLKSSTVVEDVIAEITAKLNIKSSAEREEYSLFYVVEKDNHFCSIARDEYAFDITTELSNMEKDYYLLFQRTSWVFPIHSDGNDFYTEMMFNQVKPDYQDGLLMVLEGGRLHEEQKRGIARLAALQFRASDRVNLPTMKDMADLLPEPLLNMNDTPLQMWVNLVHDRLSQVQRLSPLSCKIAFLDELSRWILFGSTFFMIKGVTDPRVPGRCLMAINKDGVHLLHTVTHESYVSYHFRDVVSSRHAQIGMTSYLDVKIGDLMSQKIVRIETDQTGVISPLIGKYIQVLSTIQAIPSRKQ